MFKGLPKISITGSKKDAKIYPSGEYILKFDGASKGNPGLAGAGMVIYKNNEEIWSSCKYIGHKTNNQAEYSALIFGLKGAIELGIKSLSVYGDSLLVINQVTGLYKVKSDGLIELHKEVINLKAQFDYIEFNHVYRENNKRADELSNLALENVGDLSKTQTHVNAHVEMDVNEFIKVLDEDWDDEYLIEEIKLPNETKTAKKKRITRPSKKNDKQSAITQFFKVNSLFPEIQHTLSKNEN